MTLTPEDERTKTELPALLGLRRLLARRARRTVVPQAGPVEQEQEQSVRGGKSGTLRAAIFGVNDGLVSNTALLMGFAGASQSKGVIVLAGISGLIAGAGSMGAGEYVSMRVQREVLERMLHLEAHELAADPEGETEELAAIYRDKGIPAALAHDVASALMRDPATALDTHAREELGIDPHEGLGSPIGAAISSFLTFAAGATVPLIPFLIVGGGTGIAWSSAMAGVALAAVGVLTSRITGRSAVGSGARMLLIGGAAALGTYLIGLALGVSVAG